MKKRIKEVWEEESGYFTLEAAFLVPLLFLILFAVMLSGLYICDLNQAKSFLNRRVTELSIKEEDYDSHAYAEDKNQIRKMMFISQITDFSITQTEKQVKGSITLSMSPNVPVIGDWLGRLWTDSFSLCVDVGDNVDMLRRWEQNE